MELVLQLLLQTPLIAFVVIGVDSVTNFSIPIVFVVLFLYTTGNYVNKKY